MRKKILFLIIITFIVSCSSDSIKEKINKAGDVAGQTAGEFIEGASKGVQKAFDINVTLPDTLKEKGIAFGKASVYSDSLGSDNMLVLYVIFNKDYTGTLTAKVFDEQSLEMGRSLVTVTGKKEEAKYIEFHFGKYTNIDSKNVLTIE